ncbi:fimbria/pilus outer membrane usher protein [Acinetobacter sp. AG3]|jgi:outer membrane usher protein|uniref:fimbria/pilus outer membrane usher protein n=3 Tax=unclassified Acinetobacter TaxID=196816 RepID=UPI001EEF89AF|nr:fimbria/pilus outer membrane usher protein [Acinetobacter sp. AG3]MCG7221492.1 fimbrial biogenesis outer membrane usher protein [Acinetobacter sp. AG3]
MFAEYFGRRSLLSIFLVGYLIGGNNSADANDHVNNDGEYIFDQALFRGQSDHQIKLLERLSEKEDILPGFYKVDVFVNKQIIERMDLKFVEDQQKNISPCFDLVAIEKLGISEQILINIKKQQDQCVLLSNYIQSSSINFNFEKLRLDISIPQNDMHNIPRGYVNASQWDAGESIGFINYLGNYYHTSYQLQDHSQTQSAAYVSLNGGVNIGKWQYRQQSNINYSPEIGTKWTNIRSYISRPIEPIQGVLTLGQTYSSGKFFSGLSFNGLSLSSDERMLPDSLRGYAPTIQGIAKTNANVSILQNGKEIYQSTVAPGAFKISDLYPTNFNGDLIVKVREADGTISQFSVPFSAVPESLRLGASRYNLDVGKTRDIGEDTFFSNLTYQRGISNSVTLNSGLRLADGYQAGLLGGTYASNIGAFGANLTYSRASLPDENIITGWMTNLTYSKTFQPTNTTVSLAGYRYSTEGYRDLGDVIGLRNSYKHGYRWESSTYQQRSRFEITLNQSLGDYGILFLSGSAQNYRDGRDNDVQAQIGYGKAFQNGLTLNLAVMRQRYAYDNIINNRFDEIDSKLLDNRQDTSVNLSLSFPLGRYKKTNLPNLDLAYSHAENAKEFYQSTLSGSLTQDQSLNYAVGLSHDRNMQVTTWNTNLNKRLDNSNLGLNASMSDNYWQVSTNLQGALAVHSGGITFGPYLGETFALVEAKGAEGARLFNGQGTRINHQGYALIPAITPYRYNNISLEPKGISDRVEIETNDQRIVPYAGAAVKVKFKTRMGYPLLIQAKLDADEFVPLGADVIDSQNNVIGMVGQSGQMYVRTSAKQGVLTVKWGEESDQKCDVHYQLNDELLKQTIIRLEETCKSGELK